MAWEFTVKDTMHLYSDLQHLARFDDKDSGDHDPDSAPPYKITPNDMDGYTAARDFCSIFLKDCGLGMDKPLTFKLNDETLDPLQLVELYRQLVFQDKQDGKFDGKFNGGQLVNKIFLPALSSGVSFWGNEWTPASRLKVYLNFYTEHVRQLDESYKDSKFPLGRSYMAGIANSPSNKSNLRKLYPAEKIYIRRLADKIKQNNPNYANLLEKAIPKISVLQAYIIDPNERADLEPAAFGLTPLFSEDNIGVYLIIYPQFGQETITATRTCIQMQTKKGWRYKCLPTVGTHSRKRVLYEYLLPYYNHVALRDYKNIRLYLSMARVQNMFRYVQKIRLKDANYLSIIHEVIHNRNVTKPAEIERFSLAQFKDLLDKQNNGALASFNDCHKLGFYLTHIQRIAFEESERIRQAYALNKQEEPNEDYFHFVAQLYKLANEAEENLVDSEAWRVYYRGKNLKPQPWVFGKERDDEEKLIFNRNEIELIKFKK